jgi:hypothetical protein
MAYDDYGFSIDDAIARSQDVFEVDVTEWGDPVSATGSVRYPPIGQRGIPASLAAVAIGPRSTIDHAWITWFRDKALNLPASGDTPATARISSARYLSHEAPLLYTQRAALGTATNVPNAVPANGVIANERDAMRLGTLYAYPVGPTSPFSNVVGTAQDGGSTLLPAQYVDQFNTARAFRSDGPLDYFEPPTLQLVLYLRPPAFGPYPKRAPLIRNARFGITAAAHQRIAMLPIYGRKHVRIQALSSANFGPAPTGVFSLYAGLVRNVNPTALTSSPNAPVFEAPAGTVLTNPVGTVAALEISNPNADYLALYVGAGATVTGGYTVVASD